MNDRNRKKKLEDKYKGYSYEQVEDEIERIEREIEWERREIKDTKEKLPFIANFYSKTLRILREECVSSNSRSKSKKKVIKMLGDQMEWFDRAQHGKMKMSKFEQKTNSNFTDIDKMFDSNIMSSFDTRRYKVLDEIINNNSSGLDYNQKESMRKYLKHFCECETIHEINVACVREYSSNKNQITRCEDKIKELEEELSVLRSLLARKRVSNTNTTTPTTKNTTIHNTPVQTNTSSRKTSKDAASASHIINGPKKQSLLDNLKGVDVNIEDIIYLYELSMNILSLQDRSMGPTIMGARGLLEYDKTGDPFAVSGGLDFHVGKRDGIYNAYGVNDFNGLLNKYCSIRDKYFKAYKKLKPQMQEEYSFSKVVAKGSSVGFYGLNFKGAYLQEQLKFPPSREELISYINRRAVASRQTLYVGEKVGKNGQGEFEMKMDREVYDIKKDNMKRLTEYMTAEEAAKLCYHIINHNTDTNNYFFFKYDAKERIKKAGFDEEKYLCTYEEFVKDNLVKIFCEIIFAKEGKKYLDEKQYNDEIEKIRKKYFKAYSNVSDNNYGTPVDEKQHQERKDTVYKEYLKYRMALDKKETFISFSEFAKQKYGVVMAVSEEKVEKDLLEMRKMKR